MKVFLGADHRGFKLKEELKEYLEEAGHDAHDIGAFEYLPDDDYPDYSSLVAQSVSQDPKSIGVLICGGGGMEITANRFKGIRCALGFNENQVKHVRENDHANILALPADYIDAQTAKNFVKTFIETDLKQDEKYLRRVRKNDELI